MTIQCDSNVCLNSFSQETLKINHSQNVTNPGSIIPFSLKYVKFKLNYVSLPKVLAVPEQGDGIAELIVMLISSSVICPCNLLLTGT